MIPNPKIVDKRRAMLYNEVTIEKGVKKMNKQEMIKLIKDHIVIHATSPWDGEAIFDNYSVIIHKYDNEDLSFINDNDPRIICAAERIFKLIDSNEWDQLVNYYLSAETYTQSDGERKPIPRGGRNG